jgi:uncharacterized protein (TIGR02147 family)
MVPSVFEFNSYKEYLNAWLKAQPKGGHGLRKRIAETIGTQTGFVTQVLSGSAHFSSEQILAISEMQGLNPLELQFLLLLLQWERAGTQSYKHYVERQIQKQREDNHNLSNRLREPKMPSEVDQGTYFSSWIYACIHVMTTCERFHNSPQTIAEALGLPISQVKEVLEFLLRSGLMKGEARLHLGTDSPFLRRHHTNMNLLAMQNILSKSIQEDLHYSSIVSVSAADVDRIREIFTRSIQESKAVVKRSKGEKVYSTTLNFFKVC